MILALHVGLSTSQLQQAIDAHLVATRQKPEDRALWNALNRLIRSDVASVKHIGKLARQDIKFRPTAVSLLGAAASGGHLKQVCHEAQKVLIVA